MAKFNKSPTAAVETHGCKLNQSDSLTLSREFQVAGFSVVPTSSPCDIYIVNTCSVTHVADRKGRQSARAAKRRNPQSKVIVTGCYAERDRETIEAIEEVDLVFGNTSKAEIVICFDFEIDLIIFFSLYLFIKKPKVPLFIP